MAVQLIKCCKPTHHECNRNGAERDMFAAGRYLDRHEKRSGEWRIAHRQAVYDWTIKQAATDSDWRTPPMVDLIERGRRFGEDRSSSDKRAWLGID